MTRARSVSYRQRLAIEALAAGKNKTEACVVAGVQPCTLSRWMGENLFRAALAQAQDDVLGHVVRRMGGGAAGMLLVLEAVANDKKEVAATRVRAALGWLAQLWKAEELRELAERIAALEARMKERDAS